MFRRAAQDSAGKNFIHRAGDGRVPPLGYIDITGVTTGDDFLFGFEDNDILFGDAGNDLLNGGAGADAMTGAAGRYICRR